MRTVTATAAMLVAVATTICSAGGAEAAFTVSGTLTELTSGAPISGATVTVGHFPPQAYSVNGHEYETGCSVRVRCGSPLPPTRTAVTAANGAFTVANVPTGTFFLEISVDAFPARLQTYAILHRAIVVDGANLALGTVHLAKLTNIERAWLKDLDARRADVSYPATGPVVIDEYAEEQARRWARDVDEGVTPFSDERYRRYQAAYARNPGAISIADGALAGDLSWRHAESAWFGEKANCAPDGAWPTCAYGRDTGHYINLSQSSVAWVGLGEDLRPAKASSGIGGLYPFDVMAVPI